MKITTSGRHQQVEVLPASLVISALPKAYFDGRFTMMISGNPECGGFVKETVTYPIEWRWGKTRGNGFVRVTPLSTWMSELEISLEQPQGLASVVWEGSRLTRVAQEAALGIRRSVEQVYAVVPQIAELEPADAGSLRSTKSARAAS